MLLAGDVGGTKTLLGLFERGERRPKPSATHSYVTGDFHSFTEILDAFARDVHKPFALDAASVGVAGPVVGAHARLTNITWDISADEITARFGTPKVALLNDLEAMAYSVDVLEGDEIAVLQTGSPRTDGNAAVIAAGTGMGQALLHRVDGRLVPVPSEAGHADFAPRTEREIELLRMMRDRRGRCEVEDVLCGPGLVNIYALTHRETTCSAIENVAPSDAPARISQWGLTGRCPACVEALQIFVSAYGAEAGNLALRGVALAGIYVGGGIAPKILPLMQNGRFIEAFLAKGAMSPLVAQIPVKVILNAEAGLLGAAVHAQGMAVG